MNLAAALRRAFVVALWPAVALAARMPGAAEENPAAAAVHPWLAELNAEVPVRSLDEHFPAPPGFVRVSAPPQSFAAFLRTLPVRLDRTTVLDFRQRPLIRPSAAVIHLDVGTTDAQQCADTALRLYAEWRWSRGLGPETAFHFTSGDRTRFIDWVAGERITAVGRGIERHRGAPRRADHGSFRRWLDLVFRYAGTQSLRLDTTPVGPDAALAAGDVFVEPGSPGHAVMLIDLAESADGRRVALIGQGYMPAEELHILGAGAPATVDGRWFLLPGRDGTLATPSWRPFDRGGARRFPGVRPANL